MKKSLLKKGMSLLLTLAMLCGLMAPTAFAAEEHTYSDTHGNWAETAIERWSDYGILQGNNGKFNPGGQLTRAHMAAILSRLLVLPEAEDAGFKDVKAGAWYADYINRCAEAGIMLGSDGYANPDAPITRQQAVVMLARALGIEPASKVDLTAYTDAAQVSDYAVGYMAAMVEAGIVNGTSETTLSPYANITRAATVTILDRAIEVYANEEGMDVEAEGTGLVLVVADKVDVTAPKGTTIVVAEGVQKTTVNGKLVAGGKTVTASAPVSGGGGSSRPSTPSTPDTPDVASLIITESQTVSAGDAQTLEYNNVTITDAVGNGEVTLENLTIYGDLTIQGGGAHTIRLVDCKIHGKVIMDKAQTGADAEAPRLHLTNTPAPTVEAKQPAIIEAGDEASKIGKLSASDDVTIKGEKTKVETVAVPTDAKAPEVTVAGGAAVENVVVQSPATVAPTSDSKVNTVQAEAAVTVASGSVENVEIPAGKKAEVTVAEEAAVKAVAAKGQTTVKAEGKVETVVATAPVTVASGSVETVEVPSAATATVTVADDASVDKVDAKGATTIEAKGDGQVIAVNAQADVTVASGNVETITVPENAGAVEVAVSADAVVKDVAVNQATGTTIKVESDVLPPVSSTLPDVEVTVKDKENNVAPPPHVHMWEQDPTHQDNVEATCDHPGKLHHSCNKPGCPGGTKEETIPAKGHNWTLDPDHPENKAPTCTEAGVRVYTCEHKNTHIKTESIPATSHSWGAWTKADDTNHQRVCANENCPIKTESAAHKFDAGVVTTEPTCTVAGVKTYTCSVCSGTKTEAIAVLAHEYDTDGKFDGQDASGHWYVCNRGCGEKNVIAHTVVVDTAKAATCEATGLTDGAHCGDCAYVIVAQETVDKLGHNFNVDYSKDETDHWHVCSRCDETDTKEAHKFNTTNCAEKATCTVCQYEKAAGKHSWDSGKVTKEPTCTVVGVKSFTCTRCSATKTEDIAVLGHEYDTDGKFDGQDASGHWYVCNRGCGEKNVIAHTVVVDAAKAATCEATGLTEGSHCGDCGYVIVAQKTVDALNHKWSAWTKYDEKIHTRTCANDATHTESGDHVFGDDYICDTCGYGKSVSYPVFIRHMKEELAVVDNALEVVNGKVQITIPGYGTYGVGDKLPEITREGWTYAGWSIGVENSNGGWDFYVEDVLALTADIEKELLKAIDNGYEIFLNCAGIPMGDNGFSVDLRIEDGELVYTLIPPAGEDDDVYYLDLFCLDRATTYSCSVWKDDGYEDSVWALIDGYGVHNAFEVRDEADNLLAVAMWNFPGFGAWYGGMLGDYDTPVITIDYAASDVNNIVYNISGLTTKVNYDLADLDADREGDVYYLGAANKTGSVYLITGVNVPLSSTVELWGKNVSYQNDAGYIMEILQPVKVSVPAFDPDQLGGGSGDSPADPDELDDLLDEAEDLGLLEYVDSTSFAPGGSMTRLQIAMLAGALGGYDPADADGMTWPFTDGADLTAEQKAIIMLLDDEGSMAGYSDGSFNPGGLVTVGQAIKVLHGALGWPLVDVVRTNNLDPDHWAYVPFTMLDNLGILGDDDLSINEETTSEQVLSWVINSQKWLNAGNLPSRFPVKNARFDGTKLAWDVPTLPTGLDEDKLEYRVRFKGRDGGFAVRSNEDCLRLWYAMGGEYDFVEIVTLYDDLYQGKYTTNDLRLIVNESMGMPANVRFKADTNANGDAGYTLTMSGLTPNEQWNIFLGEEEGHIGQGIGRQADANGNYEEFFPESKYEYLAEMVENGGYFLLREYPSWSINSTEAKMDIVNRGGWYKCADGSTANTADFEVSNIRFEGQYLMWDAPVAAANNRFEYRVELSADGGDTWIDGCGTDRTEVAHYAFSNGTYNKVRILSTLDGQNPIAMVEQAISLTVKQDADKAAPTVTFDLITEKDQDGDEYEYYKMTVTGLAPETSHILSVMDLPSNWHNRNFHEVVSDANGIASTNFWDIDLVESGYYSVIELTNCIVAADRNSAENSWAYRGGIKRCFPATNKVSFTTGNNGFLVLNWDYELPADAGDFNGMLMNFYNATEDEWVEEWIELGTSHTGLNHIGRLYEGNYTKVSMTLINEVEDTNGGWYVKNDKFWFEANINLTVTEATDAPDISVKDLGNGEYDVTVSGLSGETSTATVHCAENSDGMGNWWGTTDASWGETDVTWTLDWNRLSYGFVRAYEITDVTASGTTASFELHLGDWEKAIDCGHVATNNHPVSNIHLEGEWLHWDEPAKTDPDYGYEVCMSQDGGQTWIEQSFYGENQTKCHIMRVKPGVYNAIRIKTFLPEDCCDREVGCVIDTSIKLTVLESAAATPATVTFVPVAGKTDTYSIVIDGLTPGNWADLQLALLDGGEYDGWGSYGTGSADGSGRAVRDEINSYWPDEYSMEDLLTDGYYDLYEFDMDVSADGKTGTMTRISHGGWTKSIIGTLTYSDTAWFEIKGDGSLYFCWDMTPMADAADYADGYSIYLNDGTNWERVDGTGGSKAFWRVTSPGMESGTYTGIRLMGRDANGNDTLWFEKTCSLIITDGAASNATATFNSNTNGNYDVELRNFAAGAEVAELIVSDHQGLGDIDYECDDLGGYQKTMFEDMEIRYPNGYYRIREYSGLQAKDLTASFTINESAWTQLNLGGSGSGDSTTLGTVSFVADGTNFKATWSDYGYARYKLIFVDSNGNEVMSGYSDNNNVLYSTGLASMLPRPTSGTNTYTLEVYGANANYQLQAKVAVSPEITVQVSGAPLAYTIAYNDPSTDNHTVTFTNGAHGGLFVINAWYEAGGEIDRKGSNGGNSSSIRLYQPLADGDVLDLRAVTAFAMTADGGLTATMTEPSTVTYVKPAATNTFWFTTLGDYALGFHWDYDELTWDYTDPTGFENVYEYTLQFSEDNGTTWTEGVGIPVGETSTWLTDADLEAGKFNALRMMVYGKTVGGTYEEKEWFRGATDLTITEETATFDVAFADAGTNGYAYTISNINLGTYDSMFYAIEFTDDNTSSGMKRGSGGGYDDVPAGGSITETENHEYIADGYYRIALFYNAAVNGNAASVTMQKKDAWEKCFPTTV